MYKSTCVANPDSDRTQQHSKSPQWLQLDLSCFSNIPSTSHRQGNLDAGQHIHETKTYSSNEICISFQTPSTSCCPHLPTSMDTLQRRCQDTRPHHNVCSPHYTMETPMLTHCHVLQGLQAKASPKQEHSLYCKSPVVTAGSKHKHSDREM